MAGTYQSVNVVAGIMEGQCVNVAEQAAAIASQLGGRVLYICADPSVHVSESGRYSTIDSDIVDDGQAMQDSIARMKARLNDILSDVDVEWSIAGIPGAPADVLDAAAVREQAAFIVIGSREPGLKARFREAVGGKVAETLVEMQTRPVVIVPQRARIEDDIL